MTLQDALAVLLLAFLVGISWHLAAWLVAAIMGSPQRGPKADL